jgi:flagellar hook protein FlgE
MLSSISTALSALQADSTAIDVTGNNLANLNTTGFKTTEVQFADLMSQSLGLGGTSAQLGLGVGPIQTSTVYSQGVLTSSTGLLDSAISGNGFFVVQDGSSGQTLYTRDGSFQLDTSGNLITSTGQYVQGWNATNGVVDTSGAVGDITVPTGSESAAKATTTMDVLANLNADGTVGATDGSFSTPIQVYDSLGAAHTLTVSFTKTAANTWTYNVTIPAADLTSGAGSTTPTSLATGTLSFDGNGNLTSPAPPSTSGGTTTAATPVSVAITGLADGATDQTISWNLFSNNGTGTQDITQYAETSAESKTTQDGYAAGQITEIQMETGGTLVATYSNGKTATVGQLAVASISNPGSLVSVGDNNLAATAASAAPVIGAANTGGRGQIEASELEASTVDMATEFTNLLAYERSYQAASKVVTTGDEMEQETLALIK